MKRLSILGMVLLLVITVAYGQDAYKTLAVYIELLRSDVRAVKAKVIAEDMDLTEEQESAFWPVYRKFESELSKINDQKVDLIHDYAHNYDTLTDEKAKELVEKSFEIQEKRLKLRKEYFSEFEKALSSVTAAKFIQLEHQINLLADLQIASELPLIK